MDNRNLSSLLKLIAHPERMMLLFLLLDGEHSTGELSAATGQSPTAVSSHLAKLRTEGIVDYTRYHRILEYRLVSEEAAVILTTLRRLQESRPAA